MRKRTKVRGVKIYSCTKMKLVRYAFMALCLLAMSSCHSKGVFMSDEAQDSWGVYCSKYHVNPTNPTEGQENFYLDCYVGSVEEERDLGGIVSFHFDTKNVLDVVRGVFLKDTYYVVYTDSTLDMEHECLAVDYETANMVKTAIMSSCGRLSGYLVLDEANGVYNYNHEIR